MLPPLTIDISDVLRSGVYILHLHGRPVYVGRAKCILAALANQTFRNSAPAWLPGRVMRFDRIEIIPCGPDRSAALVPALIAMHQPIHNLEPKSGVEGGPLTPQPPPPRSASDRIPTLRRI